MTVGRLVETKGYRTVIEVARRLLADEPDLSWTIIGDGPMATELMAARDRAALGGRLTLAGSVTHHEALEIVAGAGVMVLPCETAEGGQSDGIPVALMEAMALGVPVITCPVGGIAELVSHGSTGFLVDERSPQSTEQAIRTVLFEMSDEERQEMTRAARAQIDEKFDLRREAGALQQMMSEVMSLG